VTIDVTIQQNKHKKQHKLYEYYQLKTILPYSLKDHSGWC